MSMYKHSCTSWYDQYHSISKTIYGNHLKSTYFKDNLHCLILPQPFFFLIFVPGISFQHQLMGSPGNSPAKTPSPTASRFTFKSPSGSGSTTLNSPAKSVGEQNPRNNYPLWFFIVGIRIVQLVSEGIQLNISVRYIGSYYPLWNQPIPPWEKECHLQKCLLAGICLFPGR